MAPECSTILKRLGVKEADNNVMKHNVNKTKERLR